MTKMLINPTTGREVRAESLPKGRAAQAVLAKLIEVAEPRKDRSGMFSIEQRAVLWGFKK
jgi:hypothetical protein